MEPFIHRRLAKSALLAWSALFALFSAEIASGQAGRPLVDHSSLKLGVSYSEGFVTVVRNRDQSEATLLSDSDYSPYVSFASPPLFLFGSNLAIGLSLNYSEFTSSQQQFAGRGPAALGSTVEVQMLTITPELSLYLGKESQTQFLRFSFGQGWGFAELKGRVQFGNRPGAENSELVGSPSGATPAVSFSVEYRLGPVSLAYFGGGPKIETPNHTYTLGEDTAVLSLVFNL